MSELLGKETIDTNTYGKSEGRSGSYSTNYQISGRELLTPDEVRMLDNRYAILFIRGELPVMDLKYAILKHPNVAYTADGKGGVYQHGEVTKMWRPLKPCMLISTAFLKWSFRKRLTSCCPMRTLKT